MEREGGKVVVRVGGKAGEGFELPPTPTHSTQGQGMVRRKKARKSAPSPPHWPFNHHLPLPDYFM